MKKLSIVFALALTFFTAKAQEIKVGPGLDIITPMSKGLSDVSGAGFGLSIRGQVGFVDKFSIMGTLGYQGFSKVDNVRISMIPAQFGFKYALMDAELAKLYISLEAGIHSVRSNNDGKIDNSSSFSYAPGFGVQIQNIDLSTKLQLMDKFQNSIHTNYFNIRLGYTFGI